VEGALRGAAECAARGGWRAWGAVRAGFERVLADPADPAIASAEIASEVRRDADYVRAGIALTFAAADVADALVIAWDAFHSAALDDLTGWEVTASGIVPAVRRRVIRGNGPLSLMRSGASEQSAALPGRHPRPCRRRLSHRPLAGTGQASTRKVCGRVLRRVAAECGEDIAPMLPQPGVRGAAAARVIDSATGLRPREASPSRR
jgi:hypothetical protein